MDKNCHWVWLFIYRPYTAQKLNISLNNGQSPSYILIRRIQHHANIGTFTHTQYTSASIDWVHKTWSFELQRCLGGEW